MSDRFLLDTNIISEIVRQGGGSVVLNRIVGVGEANICTSAIVASELRYGAEKKGSEVLLEKVERALRNIEILPYAPAASHGYATLRTALEREGRVIGANDMLIAAHALSLGAILVTDNIAEFARVKGLRIENWLRSNA
ncbi:type II toxin-antitoxin system VapC family toxin [Methylobacterium sp. J-048]|uniref:type II toxin-antitoxin system VapC family toxin n=1 Tax=Methylobacterium sp. J-048 TaxID=2836635 RepID=UPI001FBB51E2|nr:type II toxin-antitoxin system VapC family toxin [Methylobacterium sp. J-048]MCJ2055976.1 type II toxin-antitoxin system VapC family toxin [Methylobacterium sp. J-048]